MNAMCGIDLYFSLSGLGLLGGIEPRALPWAISLRRVAADAGPIGAKWDSPGQRPGISRNDIPSALKGPDSAAPHHAQSAKREPAINLSAAALTLAEATLPARRSAQRAGGRGLGYGG